MKSKMSKICLSSLILCIILCALLVLFCFIGSHFSSSDFSWLLAIILVYGVILVPYYIGVFIASIICDNLLKKDYLIKNIILSIMLIGPIGFIIKIIVDIILSK